MNKSNKSLLLEHEVIGLVVGFVIGVGFLSLPNAVAKEAKQDGWISVLLGGVYPLFLAFLLIYYCKKHPNEDILVLSKKYLGKFSGTICNFLFMAQFAILMIAVASGFSTVFIVFATPYLTPVKIFIPLFSLAVFTTLKGIKVLGRISKLTLYLKIILSVSLVSALFKGNYLNLFPVFKSDFNSIYKGSLESIFSYTGFEGIFLLYPLIKNKNKIASMILKAVILIITIYAWNVIVTTIYMGYKVSMKALWPVLLVTESINLPILNSTRFIFLVLWTGNMIAVLSCEYYAVTYIAEDMLNLKNNSQAKKYFILVVPILIYFSMKISVPIIRRSLLDKVIPKITLFNFFYITIIAVLIFINDKIKNKSIG